ncbi:DUF7619 domain-containing protein [Flavobacterium pallidum]|uniref:T9SS C-terminal target domain-containing protein n=1 Tax=Flavobacterium pallidum TaxID=2172098 RepID=A0A2S1SJW3_9FLAO|nr:T9SS type A sorting domain-containing protein [Flavobacterium pallidum]AWI26675.1 T9SS C-terminal target domain-containing protein [Flavobacterium pallidum]
MKKFYFFVFGLSFCLSVNAQAINFTDPVFKAKLLASNSANMNAMGTNNQGMIVDTNGDLEIDQTEALAVAGLNLFNVGLTSLGGIEYFTNLKMLDCSTNNLTSLNIGMLSNLQRLYCNNNALGQIDLNGLGNLLLLRCSATGITSLDLNLVPNLTVLISNNNNIPDLLDNLPVLHSLLTFGCRQCGISGPINLTAHPQLQYLDVSLNAITGLQLDGLTELRDITCENNNLTTLDITSLPKVQQLYLNSNQLETLFLKNGKLTESYLRFDFNPSVKYICADENRINGIKSLAIQYGFTSCEVNSYCSFEPGGAFYNITGNTTYDIDGNGCEATDPNVLLRLVFSDGSNTGRYFNNTTDNYSYPVQAGTHTITPVPEYPSYFSVSPPTATVAFPATVSPFVQDFCLSANGQHNDLEINLIARTLRPGFNSRYKIICKNNGTHVQSGTLHFNFNDLIMELLSTDTTPSVQAENMLSWDFEGLQPFETTEISFVMHINSTTDNPPVNSGEIVSCDASVQSSLIDETPQDNQISIIQNVVNSLDPNDKTCLEGNTIAPEMIGKYVHYIIRFENTGTANAENIVVKDIIDTSKFDIASLIPVDGSHPFITRITDTNKVEFIFQNIQLPFDDANNDGYVAFKIKTKPTLVVGNTFSNTASIYFDYNAPILTNTTTTAIQVLGMDDFNFDSDFTLYPNPVRDILSIKSKDNVRINSISVYNVLGQLLQSVTHPMEKIDVSGLEAGNYIVRIYSEKGTSAAKFIKQ